jgi:hypothetical protein
MNVSFDVKQRSNARKPRWAQYYNSSRDNKGDAFYGGSVSQNGSILKKKGIFKL